MLVRAAICLPLFMLMACGTNNSPAPGAAATNEVGVKAAADVDAAMADAGYDRRAPAAAAVNDAQ